jgi:hypothetical protein
MLWRLAFTTETQRAQRVRRDLNDIQASVPSLRPLCLGGESRFTEHSIFKLTHYPEVYSRECIEEFDALLFECESRIEVAGASR